MGDAHRTAGPACGGFRDAGRSRWDGHPLIAAAPPYATASRALPACVRESPRARFPGDADYPDALRSLGSPPRQLFIRGVLAHPPARAVALVGARAASPYGRAMADRLARDIASLGLAVISGLARGIDAAAHEGALAAGGVTVAVLPSSLERITPPQHAGLARRITERGALVTEVAEGGPFGRGAFVKRNRIIAALAGVTVVVEAGALSGALRTAEAAAALGRPVLAVPGDVDRPTAQGTLGLLRSGARPCGDAGDVLAALAQHFPVPPATDPLGRLTAALDGVPRSLDELARVAGVAAMEASAMLLRLEWSGVASSAPGGRWQRRGTHS